jgi:hypothetical protein
VLSHAYASLPQGPEVYPLTSRKLEVVGSPAMERDRSHHE